MQADLRVLRTKVGCENEVEPSQGIDGAYSWKGRACLKFVNSKRHIAQRSEQM